jgi:hypothetical protein
MAVHMHVDARAWVRGERPWEQFLIYCDRLGRTQGTELWAAYLTDERLFDEYRKSLRDRDPDDERRPGLFGYDRVAEGLHGLEVQVASLIRVMARNLAYPLPKGPMFPSERFASEDEQAEVIDLFADIERGMNAGEVNCG